MSVAAWIILSGIAAFAVGLPRYGLADQWRARREKLKRTRFEDALKHVLTWQQRGQDATLESLAGQLGLSSRRIVPIVTAMSEGGLLRSERGALRLTAEGERLGVHVMRAHRLWERYLSDDAGMPLGRLHSAAEKAEHDLTAERLAELDAHLGHPQSDPHGDPIPAPDGSVAPLDAIALTDWPSEERARIVHVEDEPAVIFQQILAADLLPGKTLRILERTPHGMVISDGDSEHDLAHAVAANIQVAAEQRAPERPSGAIRLSALPLAVQASVLSLDDRCRGFSRRRLMDLGITPGTRVEVAMDNTFGDPRAFRIRGTTIALRREQADQVWILPATVAAAVANEVIA